MQGMSMGMLVSALLGAIFTAGLALTITSRASRRQLRATGSSHDADYAALLATLSASSLRHRLDPFADVDWDAAEHAVTPDDPRWILTQGPLARTSWYCRQPLDRQIAMGMWQQANTAKVAMQFESMLIRGLVQFASRTPNDSPEHRYCMHEAIEECNHVLMFQELVNRIGFNVPGMPSWMRWLSPLMPLYAGPFPNVFFFGVLAGEVPVDVIQTRALRNPGSTHPLVEKIMAIHVAEEARHISFADAYLRRRVPNTRSINRVWMSFYVPVVMRVLAQPIVVPPRRFCRQFQVPRPVRKQLRAGTPESRQELRNTFADIRMLCHDIGLMTVTGRMMWRLCNIGGPPSRYRSEPRRTAVPASTTGG